MIKKIKLIWLILQLKIDDNLFDILSLVLNKYNNSQIIENFSNRFEFAKTIHYNKTTTYYKKDKNKHYYLDFSITTEKNKKLSKKESIEFELNQLIEKRNLCIKEENYENIKNLDCEIERLNNNLLKL